MQEIINRYKKHGYKLFTEGDYNLNIFGIRSTSRRAGFFDDKIGCLWKENGVMQCFMGAGTVDCGEYYMKNLMHPDGAAFMVEGQYRGLWKLGTFHNTPALIQVAPVKYYRDKDLDNIIELDPSNISEGKIGLFYHSHFQGVENATEILNSSAACWAHAKTKDYHYFMGLCYHQVARFGEDTTFTCTLFND